MNLKTAYEPYFKIGVAISRWNLHTPAHVKLLKAQFNSFTCENDMKPMFFMDAHACKQDPEKYDLAPALQFDNAIPYLEFAKANGIPMRGHTLVWHNQTPKWFFHKGYNETNGLADKETMLARLESYIKGVLGFVNENYPGIIYAWDVVNEAIDEGDFRQSLWFKIVGEDFIFKAFEYARKYAAPSVALFYNDYETMQVWKRDLIISKILKPLIERGTIDGMGMQSHLLMDHPDLDEYRTALEMYGALGLQIQITELDMHNNDPSDGSMHELALRYRDFFEIYLNAKKAGKANITAVTFWNITDDHTWLSGFRREKSYPLLFNGKCEAKEAYYEVVKAALCAAQDAGSARDTDGGSEGVNSDKSGPEVEEFRLELNDKDFECTGLPERKERNDMQEVYDFLKEAGVYYLATVDGDQPRVRPFGTVDIFEGKLYIQTGKVKEVSKQLQKNPKAEICAFMEGRWLRVAGKLIRDDRIEAKKHMLDAYPNLQAMYSAEDDNTEVLYFEDAEATFSSFGAPSRSFKF
ncbi:MAG: endo-1,4-beta-xylanase [Lachnospiraceae bacterium]|nr:endo-1,4-beta-xylanase [Lachnospiraceae bacterium]